jgi:hypothetical protein
MPKPSLPRDGDKLPLNPGCWLAFQSEPMPRGQVLRLLPTAQLWAIRAIDIICRLIGH